MSEPMPRGIAWMDGRYVSMEEAVIPVLDWGFLRSDATHDVVHVWKGRFFRLDSHLDRFLASCAKLRLDIGMERAELAKVLATCVTRAGLDDAYVEMICTRGVSATFSRDPRDARNRFIAFAIDFGWILRPEEREQGLSVHVSAIQRIPPQSVDPTVKNYHWLDLVNGMFEAYETGARTVLLTTPEGNIAEGPGFNIFVVSAGEAVTPDSGVLEGITRLATLDLMKELGIPHRARPVTVAEIRAADEIFATSTAGGIMPVTRLDGVAVGDGRPGPLTRRLIDAYWEKHRDPAWSTAVAELA